MLADIITISILFVLAALAIWKIVSDKKKGIGSCGCKCSDCSSQCASTKLSKKESQKMFQDVKMELEKSRK